MKISVLILSYNQEKYISNTMNSVLSQNFDGELEIVVGDDYSTDNTRIILKEYKNKYPNTILLNFQKSNLGLLKNFYNTINLCSGDLICLCGGDDTWNEGKLKIQMDFFLNNNKFDVHHSCAYIIDELGNIIGDGFYKKGKLFFDNYICASSVCFTRRFFLDYLKVVDPVSKNWKMEDYPMWLFALQNYNIGYSEEHLVNYRVVSNSITHCQNLRKRLEFEESVFEIRKFFYKNNSFILRKIKQIYYSNIASLYKQNGDKKNYRVFCLKQRSIKGIIRYFFSYITLHN